MNEIKPVRWSEQHFASLTLEEKEVMAALLLGFVALVVPAMVAQEESRIDRTAAKLLEDIDL